MDRSGTVGDVLFLFLFVFKWIHVFVFCVFVFVYKLLLFLSSSLRCCGAEDTASGVLDWILAPRFPKAKAAHQAEKAEQTGG